MSAANPTIHTESLPGIARRLHCQVVVIDGPDRGRGVELGERAVVVGTDPACDLVLTDDRASRRHLSVSIEEGRFVVEDLGSTNGTLYEGSVLSRARVPAGATLKVGRSFVRVQPVPQRIEVAPSRSRRFGELVGASLAMREVFAVLELAARGDATVLLEGETGTGKELAARALHDASERRKGPFVAIDCGALPENLLESELFGHVRGAFTGASSQRAGAFVRAHGGTIFLDELGSVSPAVQARLLRVVEERRVRPVGADQERSFDARVVAASRHDLSSEVAAGTFRPDLYYRLSVLRVTLPPLRARREDIPVIVAELLKRRGVEPGPVDGAGLDLLLGHAWPGNVRELRNVIDRATALTPGAAGFRALRLGFSVEPAVDEASALNVRTDLPWAEARQRVVEAFERTYLRALLSRCEGNLSAASRESGIDRKHLRALVKRHGLPRSGDEA